MQPRDRVFTALRHGTPDRVPLQFDLSKPLRALFAARLGIGAPDVPAWYPDIGDRVSANALRTVMGSDCVVVAAGYPTAYRPDVDDTDRITNEFGMVLRPGEHYMELVAHPLAHVTDPGEMRDYPFPDPRAAGRYDAAVADIAAFKETYFVWGDIEITIWALARHLVGMEKLMVDMAEGAPYIDVLFDRCLDYSLAVGQELVRLGVDGIWAGDDFGTQRGLMMSPRMWRRYFKERYRRLYGELKRLNPDLVIAQHSDGAVAPILEDWIEAGMEVFNPVQPNVPGHEPDELKRRFGDRLAFWGGLDQQYLLPQGSPAQIETEVKRLIDALGGHPPSGYMLAPAHIIQSDTPLANVLAFIEAGKKYGER